MPKRFERRIPRRILRNWIIKELTETEIEMIMTYINIYIYSMEGWFLFLSHSNNYVQRGNKEDIYFSVIITSWRVGTMETKGLTFTLFSLLLSFSLSFSFPANNERWINKWRMPGGKGGVEELLFCTAISRSLSGKQTNTGGCPMKGKREYKLFDEGEEK